MKYKSSVIAVAAGTALVLSGCSALGQDSSDQDSGGSSETSAAAEAIKSWEDPCSNLDNLQPIMDKMQIAEINTSDGALSSNPYGSGLDAQAASCQGLVVVSEYESIAGRAGVNEGEILVGVVPWDTVEDAELNYQERAVTDQERRESGGESFEITSQEDLASSDWDEGTLVLAQDDQDLYIDAIVRDGEWLIWVSINYDKDSALVDYEFAVENGYIEEGNPDDYRSYEFADEELPQWVADEYVPQVHQSIADQIS